MPLSITPSTNSEKAWGRLASWPLRIDIVNLVVVFVTLLFAIGNTVQCIANYTDPTNGATNSPNDQQAAAIFVLQNLLTPLVALVLSGINIYLLTTYLLHPIMSAVTSGIMTGAWLTVLFYQGTGGVEGKWGWMNSRGVYVSTVVYALMVAGGGIAGLLNGVYFVIAVCASAQKNKGQQGMARLDSESVESDAESLAPPYAVQEVSGWKA